jgi:hypothetical protein
MDFLEYVDRSALPSAKDGLLSVAVNHVKNCLAGVHCDVQGLKEVLSAQMVQANKHGRVIFGQAIKEWYAKNE